MIVADASVLVNAFVGAEPLGDAARRTMSASDVHVPHLVDVEVASALRRLTQLGRVAVEAGTHAIQEFRRADLQRHPHYPLLDRVWSLREQLSPYDAVYVALAEALDLPMVTSDQRLTKVSGLSCEIELLSN